MSTDALLTLAQWFSPSFPVGAFAYSHGLERAIDAGVLRTARDLQDWLEDFIEHGSGRNDVILFAAAYRAPRDAVAEIDATARALAASSERLSETLEQGAAFARCVDAVWATEVGARCYPVAVGCAAHRTGLPLAPTAEMFLHASVANLVSVAVRLVPLGQTEGQAALAALMPRIRAVAGEAREAGLDDLAGSCFALDIAAMQHETQYSKVFRT
ncbi:MAG: urease accessory UreF family protein [Pseudomonadota bacterium]